MLKEEATPGIAFVGRPESYFSFIVRKQSGFRLKESKLKPVLGRRGGRKQVGNFFCFRFEQEKIQGFKGKSRKFFRGKVNFRDQGKNFVLVGVRFGSMGVRVGIKSRFEGEYPGTKIVSGV